jgi:hypothetical protein
MPRSRTLSRVLAAVLLVGAVAAPATFARPIEDLPTEAATPPAQDLRMPDTRDAAKPPVQDLRSQAGTSSLAGTAKPDAQPTGTDNDTPWAAIGLGLAALAIAVTAAGVVTLTRRRSRVPA